MAIVEKRSRGAAHGSPRLLHAALEGRALLEAGIARRKQRVGDEHHADERGCSDRETDDE
jgi:hypothetical protein